MTEDDIIAKIFAPLAVDRPGVQAFGLKDDCGTVAPAEGQLLVVKTDPIVAGVHFLADDAPEDIAWKALAVNVSDLAAKAAEPLGYLVALQLPQGFNASDWLSRFASGLGAAQSAFGMSLVGGDTDRAQGPLTISITAFGQAPLNQIPIRTNAKPGDRLFVSGTIGDAAMGLHLRTTPFARSFWPVDEAGRARLVARALRPEPRLALRQALRSYATATMDVSDGLLRDCGKLCRASGVHIDVRMSDVPLSADGRKIASAVDGWQLKALTGGDDYEVLATVPASQAGAFKAAARDAGVPVAEIGTVLPAPTGTTGRYRLLGPDGQPIAVKQDGWSHF